MKIIVNNHCVEITNPINIVIYAVNLTGLELIVADLKKCIQSSRSTVTMKPAQARTIASVGVCDMFVCAPN